jgi:hypothetical protein
MNRIIANLHDDCDYSALALLYLVLTIMYNIVSAVFVSAFCLHSAISTSLWL